MGAISFNLDQGLVRELQRLLGFTHFVETGTFRGESLAAVQGLFTRCLSVELSPEYHAVARERFAGVPNVTVLLGDSAQVLAAQRSVYTGHPTLFWLDAHWCAAENSAGEKSQCPLLEEIAAIGHLDGKSAILIDDARLFLGPPPKPHEISAWPTLDAVATALHRTSAEHTLVHYNDVLLFIPAGILPALRPFLQEHTANLLTLADKARDYDSVLTQAREKEKELSALHAVADERMKLIQRLDLNLRQSNQALEAMKRDTTAAAAPGSESLANEVYDLHLQLEEARRQLQIKHERLIRAERESTTRWTRRKPPTFWEHRVAHWQAWLAERTPYPLAKLQQYEPRPLRRENFPTPKARAKWPRICVLTPSYQQAAFVETTMLSVLDQNYPNLAYGVQDGGSTDGSAEIITRLVPRLSHAESAPDDGQGDAIRKGFTKLYPRNEDIMAWVNSDDVLMPGALHYVGEYFAKHPEVDVIYGHRVVIDEDGRETGRWFLPQHDENTLPWFDLVPQETLFWRARCYRAVGEIDPTFQFALDWDLLLRFEQAGFVIQRVPYFLGCFRVHSSQKTTAHINTVGEGEMTKLRRRTHGREVHTSEIQKHLDNELRRSAVVEWLHRWGIRR